MTMPSILLIDDDVEILNALRRFLRKHGYNVTATAWPIDAVELLGKTDCHFDIVIIDLRMPSINGFTMMRALRESHAIIMLTAFANPAVRRAAMDYGAIDCLEKPVDTRALLEAISRARRCPSREPAAL